MVKKVIIGLFALFFVMSCNAQTKKKKSNKKTAKKTVVTKKKPSSTVSATVNSTYPTEKPAENVMRLKEGENTFNKEGQFNITFLRVVQDSRCPMNARCIVAGNATVELQVMSVHSRPMVIQLCTEDTENAKKSMKIFESEVTLDNIYPAISTDVPSEKLRGNYVIDVKVTPTK